MTKNTLLTPVLVAMLLIALAPRSIAASNQPSAAANAIKIDNFVFGPQTITLPVGTTVTWTNNDDIPHTVVSNDGLFKSKAQDTGDMFSYTFTKVGTYSYYCSIHPKMTGVVIVK